jgi:YARHG domain
MRTYLITALAVATLSAPALADNACPALWNERNQIYHERGYCFKTHEAQDVFGNEGCRFRRESDVPLTISNRHRIDQIRRAELALHCPLTPAY